MRSVIDKESQLQSLNDWNDARLILATVRTGSFSRAALALGLDQATISRRIAVLEATARRPLFHRRRSGAQPTAAGLALADIAERMAEDAEAFERALSSLVQTAERAVEIAAGEGIISYVLAPALLHGSVGPLATDDTISKMKLPGLSFVPEGRAGDAHISVLTLAPGEVPSGKPAMRVRRVGTMRFVPVAARRYLDAFGTPETFADIARFDVLDHSRYKTDQGLAPWNNLVADKAGGAALVVDTTSGLYIPLISGCGVTLLPHYSRLFDQDIVILDIDSPPMAVELWLAAHEDCLREPAVRTVYDAIAQMFLASRWFR